MNITIGFLIALGVTLGLELAVMAIAVQCDKRHDKLTRVGTKERDRVKWWEWIQWGALVLFLFSMVFWLLGLCSFLIESVPNYNRETAIKCETIDGEFSKRLDACYKDGVKINFSDGEMVYGE